MRIMRRTLILFAIVVLAVTCAYPQESRESIDVQRARETRVKTRGRKIFYTTRFNLDELPQYKPEQKVSGTIRLWGLNYLTDGDLAKFWEEGFHKYHPDVKIEYNTPTALVAVPGLITGMADLGASRPITFDELLTMASGVCPRTGRQHSHLGSTGSYWRVEG